ncbi:unnamed protein product, partial [Didymodactylos carnosus]
MATLTASPSNVQRHEPIHRAPHQRSIMPLRRERTTVGYENPQNSSGLPTKASLNY